MIKKIQKLLLDILVGVVTGGVSFLALEFVDNGGTIGEFKTYLMDTVVPSVVNVFAILSTLYIGVQPFLNNVNIASDGLLQAKSLFNSVFEENKTTNGIVKAISEKLLELIKVTETEKEEREKQKEQIAALENRINITQQMIATGFGNIPDLVKNGNARVIYKLMEESTDETKG